MMTSIVFMMALTGQVPIDMEKKQVIPVKEVAGIYTVRGEEKGTKYWGIIYIDKVEGAYHITGVCGPSVNQGWAVRSGDFLAWSWSNPAGTMKGVTLYRINGKSLVGQWTRNGAVWTERLEWLGAAPEE